MKLGHEWRVFSEVPSAHHKERSSYMHVCDKDQPASIHRKPTLTLSGNVALQIPPPASQKLSPLAQLFDSEVMGH